ncbi:unnamed protein product [Phytophthora fragariaefolia]|uniref:Unnamed protein product n=1 Tax=Phytophthora fragariaefolia TaxID=1490495 RepID=A0A9W7CPW0_9STRA|nr:unnamed protein product [Phytophthora fragariaefolia]
MSGSIIFSAIDLTDGLYPILMKESDIPLTAVSTPSGMLWEWLVIPQGLKNAPAASNRMVSHVLRPLRAFAPNYFDDIFVHSRAEDGLSAVNAHLRDPRPVFEKMRENNLYANLKKCVFCAPEISVLGCYVSKDGARADPEKISSIRTQEPDGASSMAGSRQLPPQVYERLRGPDPANVFLVEEGRGVGLAS